ncbi:uncharacterized protein ALTATR162_LOCUS11511 [Alternaria atra]|uniref:Uncharacterized protein n=1 Tax=Alternaria atra TaxID=119953 RepID=A0A8J2NBI5_9PLEO|nr:uncharacterized protein ALTATR162_LOCUS11511 [Alternaria atra]CAG5186184.1 unnamed protein product [Alternaria atra]
MCKYTITILECGHKQNDHVDTYNCPYFERTSVACDRDNPKTKDRCTIKTWDENGICNRCLRENEEAAMRRDEEREREFKRREAAENEEALRRGERELIEKNRRIADEKWRAEKEAEEQTRERSRREHEKKKAAEERRRAEKEAEERARERSRREHEKKMAAEEARTREVERQSKAEYERQLQERLDQDMEIMIQKSLDEAARKKKEEEEEMQRALRESARLAHMERSYQEDPIRSGHRDMGDGVTEHWTERTTRTTTRTVNDIPTRTAAPPSPPATPPKMSMPPPPPAPAPKPTVTKSAPRPPPAPKPAPAPKEVNYSLPAVGDQKIGRFRLGGRNVPIHESQDIPDTPTTSGIPMSPTSPAPFVRLGGAIAPSDMPIVRELKGQVPPVVPAAMDSRAGLRRTSGPRKVPPPVPQRMGVDPKLEALLAKQRAWEPEDEGETGTKSVTPPQSPSGVQARRLSPVEFDTKRKSGWKKEDE